MKKILYIVTALLFFSCATEETRVKTNEDSQKPAMQMKQVICIVKVKEKYNNKLVNSDLKETEVLIKRILKTNKIGNYEFHIIDDDNKDDKKLLVKDIDLIITGEVVSNRQGGEELKKYRVDMISVSTIIRLQIADFKNNKIIITASKQAPAVHISEEPARKKSIERVLKEIFGQWDENLIIKEQKPFLKTIYKFCDNMFGEQSK